MTGRRAKTELYLAVLSAIKEGEPRPTRIMYATNLSWKPLCQILNTLEERGLVRLVEPEVRDGRSKNLYAITDKGESVISYFQKTRDLLKSEDLLIV